MTSSETQANCDHLHSMGPATDESLVPPLIQKLLVCSGIIPEAHSMYLAHLYIDAACNSCLSWHSLVNLNRKYMLLLANAEIKLLI